MYKYLKIYVLLAISFSFSLHSLEKTYALFNFEKSSGGTQTRIVDPNVVSKLLFNSGDSTAATMQNHSLKHKEKTILLGNIVVGDPNIFEKLYKNFANEKEEKGLQKEGYRTFIPERKACTFCTKGHCDESEPWGNRAVQLFSLDKGNNYLTILADNEVIVATKKPDTLKWEMYFSLRCTSSQMKKMKDILDFLDAQSSMWKKVFFSDEQPPKYMKLVGFNNETCILDLQEQSGT